MINPQIVKLKEERDALKKQIADIKEKQESNRKFSNFMSIVFAGLFFAASLWFVFKLADTGMSVVIMKAYPNPYTPSLYMTSYLFARVILMCSTLYAVLWGIFNVYEEEIDAFVIRLGEGLSAEKEKEKEQP